MEQRKADLLQQLVNPTKKHLGGNVLTEQEIINFYNDVKSGKEYRNGLCEHSLSLGSDNNEYSGVSFFTHNHLYGYTIIPEDFCSCSFSIPGRCVARPGCEDGIMDSFDKYKAVHGKGVRYLYSVQALVDFIVDEYPNLKND